MTTKKLPPEPTWSMLLPAVWILCFLFFFVEAVAYDNRIDINGDGITTIRDIFYLIYGAWMTATVLPILPLHWAFANLAPTAYRFLEVEAVMVWLGEVGITGAGLVLWFVLFFALCRLEVGAKTAAREWAEAWRARVRRRD